MSKKLLTIFGASSILISLIINFNASTVNLLLTRTIILSVILFGLSSLIHRYIKLNRIKHLKKFRLYKKLTIITVILISFYLIYFITQVFLASCEERIIPNHFRTNIITKTCDFGGYHFSTCSNEPWYYSAGCNITHEQKIDVFKQWKYYNESVKYCTNLCMLGDTENYCSQDFSLDEKGFNCKDLTECQIITC